MGSPVVIVVHVGLKNTAQMPQVEHDDIVGNVPDTVLALYNGFEINGVGFHTPTSGTLPMGDIPSIRNIHHVCPLRAYD
jgi:hypothetical protein